MQNIKGPEQDDDLRAEVREVSQRMGILEHRMDGFEHRLCAVEQLLSSIEATLQHVATKADVHQALNAQTWKMAGFGVTMLAATFALARYL